MGVTTTTLKISRDGAMQSFLGSVKDRCPPGQIWREFTQNAIEAYTRHGLTGPVVWYHEPEVSEKQTDRYHWGVFDTGIGMSMETMRTFLGQVFSSGGEIGVDQNHGIGSRQAGLRDCPDGIQWLSLHQGEVSSARLTMKEGKLPQIEFDDGYTVDDLHPELVKAGRGTQVIFWGMAPRGRMTLYRQRLWTKLSQRYHSLPTGIGIKVQAWVKDNGNWRSTFHNVTPQGTALEDCSEISETVFFDDESRVDVYVLRPEHVQDAAGQRYREEHGLTSRHQQAELKTRVSVVYQEECYELVVGGGAHKRIQRFGIPYGTNRVVLCVVPNPDLYIPSEERSRIVPRALTGEEGAGLPWDDWSRQFVANMPQSIRDYVEQCAVGTRVQGMQELFERARTAWRFAAHSSAQGDGHQGGSNLADPASKPSEGKKKPKKRGEPSEDERERTSNPREGGTGSRQGNRRNGFSLPNIDWVREADLPEGDPCRGQAGFYAHNTLDGPLLKLNEDWGGLATWRACVAEAHPGWREHRITQATRAVWQLLAVELVLRNRAFDRDVPSPTEIGDCFQQRMARDLILDAMNPRG